MPNASLLPIFPKHTLLQNRTLAIQVPIPMLSLLIKPSYTPESREVFDIEPARGDGVAGEGTIPGLTPKAMAVPARPTSIESRKPVLERSTRYQRTGLTRARVRETCEVDCQGSLRCELCQPIPSYFRDRNGSVQWQKQCPQMPQYP